MKTAQSISNVANTFSVESSLSEKTDKVLLKLMVNGDNQAFEVLFRRYEPRLVCYAARYVGSIDLAKDVCQEIFVKLITKPPKMLITDSLAPWLFRVARNLSVDKYRRRKFEIHESETETHFEAETKDNPLKSLTRKNDAEVIRSIMEKLPDDLKEIVSLRIYGGVSFKDIAKSLKIPLGTALWRMHKALDLLRHSWKRYDAEKVRKTS